MKIIVAHPAQQHSYRLATALKKINVLEKYATTVYYKKKSLTHLVAKLLPGKFRTRAIARNCKELDDFEVVQFEEAAGLIKLVALNTPFLKKKYDKIKYGTADRFAKKVAEYAIEKKVDAVVTYDDSSPVLFEILQEKAPEILRIMDVSAANLLYMRHIYDEDTKLAPLFAERLKKERTIVWNPEINDRTKREISATQKFFVPSEFVKKSLAFSGVNDKDMFVCPYGVDITQFSPKTNKKIDYQRPLEFIYVGGVKELKGIYYLFEAFKRVSKEKAHLKIVGSYNQSDADIQDYLEVVEFTGTVLHSEIQNVIQNADVYIFPSLGEGLSLSTLEAAACGLPLIVSENSGVNDLIENGREGFVVPIQSIDALVEKINWFIDNRERIAEMGKAARLLAESYTWDNYYSRIQDAVITLTNSRG